MKIGFRHQARTKAIKKASGGLVLALFQYGAIGAEIPTDALKVAAGVVKAPDYETPLAKSYIVANATNIFSDRALYGTNVTGQLKLRQKVEALTKLKGSG